MSEERRHLVVIVKPLAVGVSDEGRTSPLPAPAAPEAASHAPTGEQTPPTEEAPAAPPTEEAPAAPPTEEAPAAPPTEEAPAAPPTEEAPAAPPTEEAPAAPPTEEAPAAPPTEETPAAPPTEETPAAPPTEETPAAPPTEETPAAPPTEETPAAPPTEETPAAPPTEETPAAPPTEETPAAPPTEETPAAPPTEEAPAQTAEPTPSKLRTRPPILQSPFRQLTFGTVVLTLLGLVVALGLGRARPVVDGLATAAEKVEPGRAYAWLSQLQRDYPKRVRGSFAHRDAPRFIANALKEAGARDVHQEFYETAELRNVIGRIPGKDSSRCVVLGAHHDVVPGAPGAIDDGGAIAVLIEAARVLARLPEPPECDVVIAIFDGEERGCQGAFANLEAMGAEGRAKVRAALAVELVGWTQDQLVVHTIPYGFAWEAKGIAPGWVPESTRAAGQAAGVSVGYGDPLVSPWYQATIRALRVHTGSDAGAYAANGIPSAMLTGSALSNFYEGYHTPRDSMALVDSDRLDDAAKVCVATALDMAARDDAPRGLGEPYLMLGLRTLRRPALTAIGLGAALALIFAALGFLRLGWTLEGGLMLATALSTGVLALLSDVLGLLIGVPLCLGLAAGTWLERGWILFFISRIPLYIEILLVVAASATFGGFFWRGEPLPTTLVGIASVAAILAGMRITALRRRRRRV